MLLNQKEFLTEKDHENIELMQQICRTLLREIRDENRFIIEESVFVTRNEVMYRLARNMLANIIDTLKMLIRQRGNNFELLHLALYGPIGYFSYFEKLKTENNLKSVVV